MKRIIVILLSCLIPLTMAKEGEAGPVNAAGKSQELASQTALKHSNPSVAIACYGMFLEKETNMGSKLVADTVIKFSKKKRFFNVAAAIASFYDVESLIPNIIKEKNGELAAAILASKAYASALEPQANARDNASDDEEEPNKKKGKKGKKRKKGKGKKGVKAGANFIIPEELFKSKSLKTQYLTILAAAYIKKSEYKDLIAKIPNKTGKIASAKILYKVMIGDVPLEKEIKEAYAKSGKVDKALQEDSSLLMDINMDVPAMCPLVEALGRMKDSKHLSLIHRNLSSKDVRVHIDALRAMRRIAHESSIKVMQKLLVKCPWNVLIEVCLGLGEQPHVSSIAPLLSRFKKETGRFRLDVNYAISSIVGKRIGFNPKEWDAWWSKNKKTFKVDLAKTQSYRQSVRLQDVGVPSLGGFYQISIYSDHCCFVLDSSKSMKGKRIESLKENCKETISTLAKHVMYNIVDFGGDLNVLYPRTLIKNRNKGLDYIYDLELSLGTRTMDSIVRGMEIPTVDTIYFLSDGAPVRGRMQKWESIFRLISLMNRYRHIAVSTICFDPSAKNKDSMKQISIENYGHSESLDVD